MRRIDVRRLGLDGPLELTPYRHADERGFLSETWNRNVFSDAGIEIQFVQDNHSFSAASGTLRGLHFQSPPHAQAKLVRVLSGAIFDVAVDIRRGSPTFGRWVGVELSREKWNQLFVPVGFAHGFVTLLPNTEVAYKVSGYYSPEHDRGIRFDDPAIGIRWPEVVRPYLLSTKDRGAPLLSQVDTRFILEDRPSL